MNLVVIPTFNEVENIESLIGLVAKQVRITPVGFDVLFIDDIHRTGRLERKRNS